MFWYVISQSITDIGDDTQVCGDNQKLSVYATFNIRSETFDREAIRTNWTEIGCVTDGLNSSHALTGAAYSCLGMTVEMCMNFCDVMDFPVAGLEYGGECYCGNNFQNGGGSCAGQCNVPCIGDETQMCGGDWQMNVYERKDTKAVEVQCEITTTSVSSECSLGNCSEYNFAAAWSGSGINWSATGVLVPDTTDVCAQPCLLVEYYPYFIWQMHENLRVKIADRLAVDWPARIGALIGDTCSCEIESITTAIASAGTVSYGLDGIADLWLCPLIDIISKL
jgi:hypothetical protein